MVEFLREHGRDPERRARISEAARKRWRDDPEFATRMTEGIRKRWRDPEYWYRTVLAGSTKGPKTKQHNAVLAEIAKQMCAERGVEPFPDYASMVRLGRELLNATQGRVTLDEE
jgi:hypothetical protein